MYESVHIVFRRMALLIPVWFTAAVPALAHDPGLSSAEVRLEKDHLAVSVTFARSDIEKLLPLDVDGDGRVTGVEFREALPRLRQIASGSLQIQFDGRSVLPRVSDLQFDSSDAVHFFLVYPRRANPRLVIRSVILILLPLGHRQFLSLRDGEGKLLGERILDAKANLFEVDVNSFSASRAPSAGPFLVLGVKHILTGYDHLLFLFGVLLVARSLIEAARIITSFTLAHSITLALATLDLARMPPRLVELLIAASIVYVGVENIFGADLKRRWLLTFGFGLIHGFGFSSVLRQLGIGAGGGGVVLPLFSFNLGVEFGQSAVALPILPVIWQLRKQPAFVARYVPVCSLLVTVIGAYWLIQRTLLG
ncbi:MAG: HupE/UreJ family protein [Acidobacteria bacterium]|nr:HupE/UreJ family protein [Acidobacteriota bacterium]